jgi:sec-independent protein translocase protein TatB
MFGMGMGEIVLIAVVALLVLGPDRLPGAAKAIGKGIRDLRKQTQDLKRTVEEDTELGDAVRDLRSALRGDPEHLYRAAVGNPPKDSKEEAPDEPPRFDEQGHPLDEEGHRLDAHGDRVDAFGRRLDENGVPIEDQLAASETTSSEATEKPPAADDDLPVIRTPDGALSRGSEPTSDA